jgi:hypothetical protein
MGQLIHQGKKMPGKSPQKKLIFDVGIHKGEDTDYYLEKGFSVIGFDANPALITHCKKRFSKQIQEGRLILVEGAITEWYGMTPMPVMNLCAR